MSRQLSVAGINIHNHDDYMDIDICCSDFKNATIYRTSRIDRDRLSGLVYSDNIGMGYNYIPLNTCTCGYIPQINKDGKPTLMKAKPPKCTCGMDGTLLVDTNLQDGIHMCNTSVSVTLRKREDGTNVILDLSERYDTNDPNEGLKSIRVFTTKESGKEMTVKNTFGVIIVTYIDEDHNKDVFNGAEYAYPIVLVTHYNSSFFDEFDKVLYNNTDILFDWESACEGLYGTEEIITTKEVINGGMRI